MTGQWFSLATPVSSTNKTDHHDLIEILLKVALNTITLTLLMICFKEADLIPIFVHFYHIQPKTYPFHSNRKLYNIETIEWYPILTGVEK